MIASPRLRIVVCSALIAFLSACGGSRQSPQTRHYLQQLDGAIGQLDRDLLKEAAPKAPALPTLSKEAAEAQAAELQNFSDLVKPYYAAVGKAVDRVLAVCDQAQSSTHALDSAGADPAAVDLAERYTGLIDRRQQLAVNMAALVAAKQAELARGYVPRFTLKVMDSGLSALLSPSDRSAEGAGDLQPTAEEKAEMDSQARTVQRAVAAWRSDAAAVAQARADLLDALKAKFPGDDWGFLAAKPAAP